jgi:hypothetical protein
MIREGKEREYERRKKDKARRLEEKGENKGVIDTKEHDLRGKTIEPVG